MDSEIADYKSKWDLVDKNDLDAVRNWFLEHPFIDTPIHAMIMDYNMDKVRKLKQKVGLGGKMPKNLPPVGKKMIPTKIEVPEDWDNAEWLSKAYAKHHITDIARSVGLNRISIWIRLKKYGIKPGRKLHPCCNKQWLHKHYVEKRMTQHQCAKKAGVSLQTFARWLVLFKIPVRNCRESASGKSKFRIWIRRLQYDLSKQMIVHETKFKDNILWVRYYDYLFETYGEAIPDIPPSTPRYHQISEEESRITKIPEVVRQYESDMGEDNYPAHITISKPQWVKATIMERRLAVHEFARQMIQRGWIWPYHPTKVLERELENFKIRCRNSKFTGNTYNTRRYGMKILEHYFGLQELYGILARPRYTIGALNSISNKYLEHNTHNVFIHAMMISRFKITGPYYYYTIFKKLNIKGKILDLAPNNGNRALAAAEYGLKYYTKPNKFMDNAINLGFSDLTGLDYRVDDGSEKFDIVILDNDYRKADMLELFKHANRSKCLIAYVKRTERMEYESLFKPRYVLEMVRAPTTTDFLFVW